MGLQTVEPQQPTPNTISSENVQKRTIRPQPQPLDAPLVLVSAGLEDSHQHTNGGEKDHPPAHHHRHLSPSRTHASSTTKKKQVHSVMVFGVLDISGLPTSVQFLWCACGVFVFYLIYGFLQEAITARWKKDGKHLGWFMTSVQFVVYTIVSYAQMRAVGEAGTSSSGTEGGRSHLPPIKSFMWIGLFSVTTIGLSNTACEFLNYPTQVMFKCSKLIPVMLVGVFMLRKRYKPLDYGASLLITVGLILITLADRKVSPNFNVTGVTIICGALAADAIIGNLQEMLYREYSPTEGEMILYSKGCGLGFLFVVLLVTGQLWDGLAYASQHPTNLLDIVAFSVAGCAGEYFVMLLTKLFGALVAVTTTSCRKAVTLYLSFLLFPKPYTHMYLFAALSIFMGVFLNVYNRNQDKVHDLVIKWFPATKPFIPLSEKARRRMEEIL